MGKRIAAGVLGALAICSGVLGCGYAATAFADAGQSGYSVWAALLGSALLGLLTLGAFGLGADFVTFAVSGQSLRVPPRLRAVSVGVLSFFPGFVLAFLPTAFYELFRHPNDNWAPLRAFAVGAVVGIAYMLAVGVVLLKKSNIHSK